MASCSFLSLQPHLFQPPSLAQSSTTQKTILGTPLSYMSCYPHVKTDEFLFSFQTPANVLTSAAQRVILEPHRGDEQGPQTKMACKSVKSSVFSYCVIPLIGGTCSCQNHEDREQKSGQVGGGEGSYCLVGEIPVLQSETFCGGMMVMAAPQCACTYCHSTVCLKLVKEVNFILCVFCQN